MESLNSYYPDLTKYLTNKFSDSTEEISSYVLAFFEDSIKISSTPLLCVLISFFLKQNMSVILISEKEPLNHYASILRKFGLNLFTNENFCFADLSTAYWSLVQTELPLSENYPSTYNLSTSKNYIDCKSVLNRSNYSIDYDAFLPLLASQIEKFQKASQNKIVILMDKTYDSVSDINKLMKLAFDSKANVHFTLNKELNKKDTVDYVSELSDIIFEFNRNESGYSKDVDGIFSVTVKEEKLNYSTHEPKTVSLRYSLKENKIDFFTHLVI